jgi:hypothetical protein
VSNPWRMRVEIQLAWAWFCIWRAASELANVWRMRIPYEGRD